MRRVLQVRVVAGVVEQANQGVGARFFHCELCTVDGVAVAGLVCGRHRERIVDAGVVGTIPPERVPWVLTVTHLHFPQTCSSGLRVVGAPVNQDNDAAVCLGLARNPGLEVAGTVVTQGAGVATWIQSTRHGRGIGLRGVDCERSALPGGGVAGFVGHGQLRAVGVICQQCVGRRLYRPGAIAIDIGGQRLHHFELAVDDLHFDASRGFGQSFKDRSVIGGDAVAGLAARVVDYALLDAARDARSGGGCGVDYEAGQCAAFANAVERRGDGACVVAVAQCGRTLRNREGPDTGVGVGFGGQCLRGTTDLLQRQTDVRTFGGCAREEGTPQVGDVVCIGANLTVASVSAAGDVPCRRRQVKGVDGNGQGIGGCVIVASGIFEFASID